MSEVPIEEVNGGEDCPEVSSGSERDLIHSPTKIPNLKNHQIEFGSIRQIKRLQQNIFVNKNKSRQQPPTTKRALKTKSMCPSQNLKPLKNLRR